MRKWGTWKASIVVLIGLGVSSPGLAADSGDAAPPPAKKSSSGTWFPFWPSSTDKADKKAPAKAEKEVQPDLASSPSPPRRDEAAEERAREQATLLRRLAVCDQLRLIATQKKDDRLMQQAEQLDERSWQIYLRRIEHLPVSKAVGEERAPESRTEASRTNSPAGRPSLSIRK